MTWQVRDGRDIAFSGNQSPVDKFYADNYGSPSTPDPAHGTYPIGQTYRKRYVPIGQNYRKCPILIRVGGIGNQSPSTSSDADRIW